MLTDGSSVFVDTGGGGDYKRGTERKRSRYNEGRQGVCATRPRLEFHEKTLGKRTLRTVREVKKESLMTEGLLTEKDYYCQYRLLECVAFVCMDQTNKQNITHRKTRYICP